jgi:hypothetical protein
MSTSEYLAFLFDDAFLRMPFLEAMAAFTMALSVGLVVFGMWKELRGGGRSAPPTQPGQHRNAA